MTMAVLSTLRERTPSTGFRFNVEPIEPASVTTGPVVHYDGFTSVSCSEPMRSYMSSQQIEDCPYPVYRMSTAKAVWYFSHAFGATASQVLEKLPGLCVPIGPQDPATGLFPGGSITMMPSLMRSIEEKQSPPSFVAETGLSGSGNPVSFYSPDGGQAAAPAVPEGFGFALEVSTSTPSSSERRPTVSCVICMRYLAKYKWSNCTHESDGPALICLKCSNFILDEWLAGNNSAKDKHQIKTACVICRTLGKIVRYTK